jgi:hypothetical protein
VALVALRWETPRIHKLAFGLLMLLPSAALLGAAWRLFLA